MEAARPDLSLIVNDDPLAGFDGELTPDTEFLVAKVRELHAVKLRAEEQLVELKDQRKGLESQIRSLAAKNAKLQREREKAARESKEWPIAQRLLTIWGNATGAKRPPKLSMDRFEKVEPYIRDAEMDDISYEPGPPRNDLEECCAAIIGRTFDYYATERANGSTKRHHGWELIFRDRGQFDESISRRPRDWRERLERWDQR